MSGLAWCIRVGYSVGMNSNQVTVTITPAGNVLASCSCGIWQAAAPTLDGEHVRLHLLWHAEQAARSEARRGGPDE